MPTITLTSRELSEDTERARAATRSGPVVITEGGRPTQVLLSFDEFRRLSSAGPKIADLLAMPQFSDSDLDFSGLRDPPRGSDQI